MTPLQLTFFIGALLCLLDTSEWADERDSNWTLQRAGFIALFVAALVIESVR